jgi:hypothetical protein
MKKTIKIFSLVLLLFSVFVYLNFFTSIVFPWQKEEAIETTLNWGGLAALPTEAKNVSVEEEGNIFTRTFTVEFKANQSEIENWILKSKRLKNNIPKVSGETIIYDIYPGEIESFGGKVSVEKGKVRIVMSWS